MDYTFAMLSGLAILLALGAGHTVPEILRTADEFMRTGRYASALKLFQQANDLSVQKCIQCWAGLALAHSRLGYAKQARQSCERMLEVAENDAQRAEAHNLRGIVLTADAGLNRKKLEEGAKAFRAAISLGAAKPIVHFNLGMNLLKQAREPDGVAALRVFLDQAPNHFSAGDARRFVDSPGLAREWYVPYFQARANDGVVYSPESFKGRVVLLHFWASWCKPCLGAMPGLEALARRPPRDSLLVLSISEDKDKGEWEGFLARHTLNWPQVFDDKMALFNALGARTLPAYIVIDSRGVVRFAAPGTFSEAEAAVNSAVKKLEKQKAAP